MYNVIDEIKKIIKNDFVIVACSTGVDSMTLLQLVEQAVSREQIIVCHVNHQKRLQSEIEEDYIIKYCFINKIKCYVKKLDIYNGSNFQEWARNERYEFFLEISKLENAKYCLTAHHADDNLETIIMRFLKSSSLKGYAGIMKNGDFHGLKIFRPLIDIPKSKIYDYANNHEIQYYEDKSNETFDYTRNRIRNQITSVLLEENSALYDAVKYYSETLFNANLLLEKERNKFIEEFIFVNNNNEISFSLIDFLKLTDFLKKEVLFEILKNYHLSYKCIQELIKKISSSKKKITANIDDDTILLKEYDQVLISKKIKKSSVSVVIKPGKYILLDYSIEVNPNHLIVKRNGKIFNYYFNDCFPLIIRTRKDGDKLNLKYGTKSVSNYLTDNKVPYKIRTNILLLCNESDKVLYVLGI